MVSAYNRRSPRRSKAVHGGKIYQPNDRERAKSALRGRGTPPTPDRSTGSLGASGAMPEARYIMTRLGPAKVRHLSGPALTPAGPLRLCWSPRYYYWMRVVVWPIECITIVDSDGDDPVWAPAGAWGVSRSRSGWGRHWYGPAAWRQSWQGDCRRGWPELAHVQDPAYLRSSVRRGGWAERLPVHITVFVGAPEWFRAAAEWLARLPVPPDRAGR